ncbi:subtilisin [Methanosarcinales archaeon]|nr:MAG: subtilisin [Methanosarcinales archaeon]
MGIIKRGKNMKRDNKNTLKLIASTLLVCMVVVSCLIAVVPAEPPEKTPVMIGFKDKPDPGLIRAYGGEIKYEYHIVPAIAASLPEQAIAALKNNPNIAHIEPDCEVAIAEEVLPFGIDRIDAELVWNGTEGGHDVGLGRNAGDGIKIAILDTGIDYTHPDLANNVKGGVSFVDYTTDYMDDNGHGTYCAGIAAAEDNDIGVIGVAPKAHLYAVKVLDSNGIGYVSALTKAVEWSRDNDMDVISMSLCTISDSISLHLACNQAQELGTVVVAASGNDNSWVKYPAKYGSVIAVGATDNNNEKAGFSNFGPELELAAPGVGIYSTSLGGGSTTKSGTSAACPHVSGAAALVFASDIDTAYDMDGDGIWDATEIRKKLQDTARDLGDPGRDDYYGYGLVDAYKPICMHIGSIDLSTDNRGSGQVKALSTVTVVNFLNNQIANATVYGHWSGLATDVDSGITDATGQVTLESDWVKKANGTFTFTVDNVTKNRWVYNVSANNEISDSIMV